MIAEVFQENPQTVYQTLYQVGADALSAVREMNRPIEINLN